MATKKTDLEEVIDDGYVDFEIPWDRANKTPCKNVIINGKKYSIPIGQRVKVPAVVAEVLEQSRKQSMYAYQIDKEMQKEQITQF